MPVLQPNTLSNTGIIRNNKDIKINETGKILAGRLNLIKQECTIENNLALSQCIVGLYPFTRIDHIYAVVAFVNGIEVNITYTIPANVTSSIDILADTSSSGYPSSIDLYWNGSSFQGGTYASPLGDLELNDVIRIYSIDI